MHNIGCTTNAYLERPRHEFKGAKEDEQSLTNKSKNVQEGEYVFGEKEREAKEAEKNQWLIKVFFCMTVGMTQVGVAN